jgi:coniferyl-aldehyde dehydrogenase
VIEVNPARESLPAGAARKLAPTVVLDVRDDMTLMTEEIFGPVLPVVAYRDADAAIRYVTQRPPPLAIYYFGHDTAERRDLIRRTMSGGVTVNDVIMHSVMDDLPFGGVGPSGMGTYHGREGFESFSHPRAI